MNRKDREAIVWRRNKVQELLINGYTQAQISRTLKMSEFTISRDVQFLRVQAKESMKEHLDERLPLEFNHCIQGINQVLKMTLDIASGYNSNYEVNDNIDSSNSKTLTTEENRTRLQALALANDCYKYKMELMTNGAVVADALRYVEQKQNQLAKIEPELQLELSKKLTES